MTPPEILHLIYLIGFVSTFGLLVWMDAQYPFVGDTRTVTWTMLIITFVLITMMSTLWPGTLIALGVQYLVHKIKSLR